jgi:hypothetical protein
MLLDHLATALRNVSDGERHIAQQHEIIAWLERDGFDTSAAKAVLLQFEDLHGMHIAHRDWLKKELLLQFEELQGMHITERDRLKKELGDSSD